MVCNCYLLLMYRVLRKINRGNVHFTVACLVAKALNKSEAKGDLIMKDKLLLSNVSYVVIMLNRYWSLP